MSNLITDQSRMTELIIKLLNTEGEIFLKYLDEYTTLFNKLQVHKMSNTIPQGVIEKKIDLSDRNTNGRFSNNYKFTSNLAQNIIGLKLYLNVDSITKQEADEIIEHLTIHFENFVEYLEDAVKLTESRELDVPHLGEE